jgi:hypothetical protein
MLPWSSSLKEMASTTALQDTTIVITVTSMCLEGGTNGSVAWENIYLKDATARFKKGAGGHNWTVSDTYNLQTLCPYETIAFGYSEICSLYTFQEWKGFEYSIDLQFYGKMSLALQQAFVFSMMPSQVE